MVYRSVTNTLYPDPGQYTSQTQPLPNLIANPLLILSPPFPPHLRRLHISRTLIIRLRQHTHNRDQNLLHTLNRRPPLRRMLVVIRIIAGRMKDGYTDRAVGVN